ncbi:MAG: hypothetical protein WCE94_08725 [Candidatus Methanoperedens sp.]
MDTCLECGKPLRIVAISLKKDDKTTDDKILVELVCEDKTCKYKPIYELHIADIRSCGNVVEMRE